MQTTDTDALGADQADAPLPSPIEQGNEPADPAQAPDSERVLLHMPVNVRSVSMAVLAVLGTVFMLHWASAVFIPLMLGITFSYALAPIVNRLELIRLPRVIGAAVVMVSIVSVMGWTAYALSDDATSLIETLPEAAQKVRQAMRTKRGSQTAFEQVQKAATQLEQAAQEGGSSSPSTARGVTRVQIEKPKFNVRDYFWMGTVSLAAAIGQVTVVFFITFFLLASGSTFRRKMVKLAGPTLTHQKVTVQALDEINQQIQRYLLVQVFISVLVGFATWLAFVAMGMEHAAVWGVAACVLNFIPYIGSVIITVASAFVGFVQFGSVDMALLVAAVSLVLHTISGYLLTPWLTSRTSRMNAVSVFVGVLAFGWLWGVWGLLLGVPILMMVKAVCDRVDGLKPIGELLGT